MMWPSPQILDDFTFANSFDGSRPANIAAALFSQVVFHHF